MSIFEKSFRDNLLRSAPVIMLLRIVIRINIVRCFFVKEIEITDLSLRVLEALRTRGLKEKTICEFERYGTRRITAYCLHNGQTLYSRSVVEKFVLQEWEKKESGLLPNYQWRHVRRGAVYLGQMAEYGIIQEEPLRKWEAERNPLFQAATSSPEGPKRITDIICAVRDAIMELDLSEKTKINYLYCGFGPILTHFSSRGAENYSQEILDQFLNAAEEQYTNGKIQRCAFVNIRKAALWIMEYLNTGRITQSKLVGHNFAYASSDFERLLREYSRYMDNEDFLKVSSRKTYLLAARRFFRTMNELGKHCYADITLLDVMNCLIHISKRNPRSIRNMTGEMRAFAKFVHDTHPELPDITPALAFSAAKHHHVYMGYSCEEAAQILSAIDRSRGIGKRDYAMIMLANSTGLRGCDIVNLKFDNIDWSTCEIRLVQEKTNVPLALPLETDTGNAIADYILNARPDVQSDFIFLRLQRPYTRLQSMWPMVSKYAKIALGPERKMNGPHGFRRGMGRRLLEANVPASMICDILGHTSSDALRQYTATSLEAIAVCAGTIASIPVAQEALL